MLAMSQCPEGQTVLASFEFNPTIVDLANPAKYADDGRGAYLQLASNAMGGQGITTGTYFMRQLFDIKQKDASVKDRVTRHNEACHRLLQCQDVTLEKLLTAHLLYSTFSALIRRMSLSTMSVPKTGLRTATHTT
jgi:hypothetical protein